MEIQKNEEQRIKVTSAEIIVANTKGARQNKPYYEIKYKEVGQEEYNIGFGSYKLPYVLSWLDTCFEIIEEQTQAQYKHFMDRFLKVEQNILMKTRRKQRT